MITRLVRLTFKPEHTEEFVRIFEETRGAILAFGGCRQVELLRDVHRPEVMSTLSLWDDEASLNRYRDSELFAGVWARVKPLFGDRPQAFSMEKIR